MVLRTGDHDACFLGGSILSARIATPLLSASMMQIAGMSPKLYFLLGALPRICDTMFVAATWAIVSAGKPVLGTPTAFAVCHGAFTGRRDPDRVDVRRRDRLVRVLDLDEPLWVPQPASCTTSARTNGGTIIA
jgi:hypothetical protein